MNPAVEIPGARVWAWPEGRPVRVSIVDEPGPAVDEAAVQAEWARLRAANPRFFGGELLSVVRFTPGEEIVVRRAPYEHLAVQPKIATGIQQLSVTGVVVGRDGSGREAVLLGRRGAQTRIYPGMWQLGPAGGVEPETITGDLLDDEDLFDAVREEAVEELGRGVVIRPRRVSAVLEDVGATSLDAVVLCELEGDAGAAAVVAPGDWEFDSKRWVGVDALARLEGELGEQIIASTRALFRFFGWV